MGCLIDLILLPNFHPVNYFFSKSKFFYFCILFAKTEVLLELFPD
ncbi:hypothetical protein HMPREF3293_02334 [Christensenella minuta]|uniref:Uncharacterized protein n=1 Tax=Christensenella minuta TaxID=626937 RepID=A0A136Q365_9FIRM|nr:hypothetical protein HMPREF3293_02334 [Christensenella minuta]